MSKLQWSHTPEHDYHSLGAGARTYLIVEALDFLDPELGGEHLAILVIDGRPDSAHPDARAAAMYADGLEAGRLAVRDLAKDADAREDWRRMLSARRPA